MPLDLLHKQLIDQHIGDAEAVSAIIFGLCWPNNSELSAAANPSLSKHESLTDASERLNLGWNPQWLCDAGFTPFDSSGTEISGITSTAGPIHWSPAIRTCRVDDQVPDATKPDGHRYRRRTSGEVALLALWTHAAQERKLSIPRPVDKNNLPANLSPGGRGARFRDFLIYFLQQSLPKGWQVRHEVPLTHIRGLHMRRDVGDRKSDILIVDPANKLVAALSSKWTWRSDRGTEAAQMVPLTRYRPDVPYALATAEFVRAASVTRESIEDRSYHLCPSWVGSWIAVNDLPADVPAYEKWPDLHSLNKEGESIAHQLAISGLDTLVEDLKASGEIL
ncbi:hypothetical protein [Streptomyces purpureus]|uniref:hypothetical protein n=1 Tax=Streptomyces purpureus TaxID=1951 RepID=UPI00131A1630|nr:hypothetical protein [Streptomyces purpureus]